MTPAPPVRSIPLIPRARRSDPISSHAAAESVGRPDITRLQANILALYQMCGPLTDEDLVYRYTEMVLAGDWPQASLSGVRTRRKELVTLGRVQDSGRTGLTDAGRACIIWEAA